MKERSVTTYVDEKLHQQIAENAARQGHTISSYMRMLLMQTCANNPLLQLENKDG
jgi:antitoxin component of RelBE/YafQ-DinJ toxin-antitoxin module